MAALNIILLVLFVVTCVLLVFLVLLQNEEGDSIGGLFAGGSNSAFGSRSGNILTKSTYILVTIFFASSFILAVLNKTSSAPSEGIRREGQELQKENAVPWYDQEKKEDEAKTEESKDEAPAISGTEEESSQNESPQENEGDENSSSTAPNQ